MGNTFSGGRIEGGCPEADRVPVLCLEFCEDADGKVTGARGVDPFRVCRVPEAEPVPGIALGPERRSDEGDPASGDVGPMPDIRSKVTERLLAVKSKAADAGPEGAWIFLSAGEEIGVGAVELAFRFRADRGSDGWTNSATKPTPLGPVATPAVELDGRGGLLGAGTVAVSPGFKATSNSSKV